MDSRTTHADRTDAPWSRPRIIPCTVRETDIRADEQADALPPLVDAQCSKCDLMVKVSSEDESPRCDDCAHPWGHCQKCGHEGYTHFGNCTKCLAEVA